MSDPETAQLENVVAAVRSRAGIAEPPATTEEFAQVACDLSDPESEQYGYALGGTHFWAPAPVFYARADRLWMKA